MWLPGTQFAGQFKPAYALAMQRLLGSRPMETTSWGGGGAVLGDCGVDGVLRGTMLSYSICRCEIVCRGSR
jgi:hypothetical protein